MNKYKLKRLAKKGLIIGGSMAFAPACLAIGIPTWVLGVFGVGAYLDYRSNGPSDKFSKWLAENCILGAFQGEVAKHLPKEIICTLKKLGK